ncbi:type II toxin-antitoxin system HicA family toxin [Saccharopolyspora elongata]|uniref:Type II toxin-antitoxin system HicA family toxin n=2 Tax=Pseudonocardiaceae TaxID=2070 RepID=A0A4V6PE29_9PSEU|nr:type II toxin-antitoxin system HicA family toxin [Saccharopolyspora elongata]
MKRAGVVAALMSNGCEPLRNRGGHEVYMCPCRRHRTAVPNHRLITAGVCRSIGKQMACLPEGWLQ